MSREHGRVVPSNYELTKLYKAYKVAGIHCDTWLVETIFPSGTTLPEYIKHLTKDTGKGKQRLGLFQHSRSIQS